MEESNDELRMEITNIRGVMDLLQLNHKEMSAEIGIARDLRTKDQSDIKRLTGTYLLHLFLLINEVLSYNFTTSWWTSLMTIISTYWLEAK